MHYQRSDTMLVEPVLFTNTSDKVTIVVGPDPVLVFVIGFIIGAWLGVVSLAIAQDILRKRGSSLEDEIA